MKTVGIVACSNPQRADAREQNEALFSYLSGCGLQVLRSPFLYDRGDGRQGSAQEKAAALMSLFDNPAVDEIYDISGGDMSNEILPYLDFGKIARSRAVFFGYSDLTAVINAIYAKTGKASVLYQVKNLVYRDGEAQRRRFHNRSELFSPEWTILQGERGDFRGEVVGGNVRCFLKLAGTPYFPDIAGKVLFLESLGGDAPRQSAYFAQLAQLGAFENARALLLGTFTEMEKGSCYTNIFDIARAFAGEKMPIAQTKDIGHAFDSKAIFIGRETDNRIK